MICGINTGESYPYGANEAEKEAGDCSTWPKLLKDKRDELMRQFLDLVRENKELRKKVEAGIRSANTNFVIAKAGMSEETLNTALMAPSRKFIWKPEKRMS